MTETEFKIIIGVLKDRAKELEDMDLALSEAYQAVADDMEENLEWSLKNRDYQYD